MSLSFLLFLSFYFLSATLMLSVWLVLIVACLLYSSIVLVIVDFHL